MVLCHDDSAFKKQRALVAPRGQIRGRGGEITLPLLSKHGPHNLNDFLITMHFMEFHLDLVTKSDQK